MCSRGSTSFSRWCLPYASLQVWELLNCCRSQLSGTLSGELRASLLLCSSPGL